MTHHEDPVMRNHRKRAWRIWLSPCCFNGDYVSCQLSIHAGCLTTLRYSRPVVHGRAMTSRVVWVMQGLRSDFEYSVQCTSSVTENLTRRTRGRGQALSQVHLTGSGCQHWPSSLFAQVCQNTSAKCIFESVTDLFECLVMR